jgi:cytidylate kinase
MNIHDMSLSLASSLLRAEARKDEGTKPGPEKPASTITVSREFGALGHTVAAELGKRLGWPVYDQEIIHKIAEEIGRPSFEVAGFDEKPAGWFEDFLCSLGSEYRASPTGYLRKLAGVVRGLGAMGRCVLVGRGANFILPPRSTLRVRLVADLPDRIHAVARLKGITEREAAREVERTDRERSLFVSRNFGKDPADPHHYDLVINTSSVGVEGAADIILAALHRFESRRPAGAPMTAATSAG